MSNTARGHSKKKKRKDDDDSDDDYEYRKQQQKNKAHMVDRTAGGHSEEGPPPDFQKRRLIFDSMAKIVGRNFAGQGGVSTANNVEPRGTYVWTWGAGYHGQLGRPFVRGTPKYATLPKLINISIPIRQVACGGLHTCILTDDGQIYSWGDSSTNQLGYEPTGFTNQQEPRMVQAMSNENVVKIACGHGHTAALTAKNQIWTWGHSRFGQCGHGGTSVQKQPQMVKLKEGGEVQYIDVSCGDKHTAAVTKKGSVYTWGCSEHGQLGHGRQKKESNLDNLTPRIVQAFEELYESDVDAGSQAEDQGKDVDKLKSDQAHRGQLLAEQVVISAVVCGAIHTACLSNVGEVFIFGFGESFLPSDDSNCFFYKPMRVPIKEKVLQLACGQSHILALDEKGDVLAWGNGEYGQVGQGVRGSLAVPRVVLQGKQIAQISTGRYHSVALTSTGIIYTWGCGENGQLGHGTDDNVMFPRVIEATIGTVVGQIACGEHHTCVLSSTPWHAKHEEVSEWLMSEQYEHKLKMQLLTNHDHGLGKKDLAYIDEQMFLKRKEWEEERRIHLSKELKAQWDEQQGVQSKKQLLAEVEQVFKITSPRGGAGADHTLLQEAASDELLLNISPESRYSVVFERYELLKREKLLQMQGDVADASQGMGATSSRRSVVTHPHSARASLSASSGMGTIAGGSTGKALGIPSNAAMASTLSVGFQLDGQSGAAVVGGNTLQSGQGPLLQTVKWTDDGQGGQQMVIAPGGGATKPQRPMSAGGTALIPVPPNATNSRHTWLKTSGNLVRKMRKVVLESADIGEDLRRAYAWIQDLRTEYDKSVCQTIEKARSLQKMKKEYSSMKVTLGGMQKQAKNSNRMQETLQMKLNTVTIKIMETEENKKNYKMNIGYLKEEELVRYYQLEDVKKQSAENDVWMKKMNDFKMQSLEERDRAESELVSFNEEIKKFEIFVKEQMEQFRMISNEAIRQRKKREQTKAERLRKAQEKFLVKIDRLESQMEEKYKEAASMSQKLTSVNERLRYFKKRFQQIVSATGLESPEAIINKFQLKEDIKSELEAEIAEKERKTVELTHVKEEMAKELQRRVEAFEESRWKDVDVQGEAVRKHEALAHKHLHEFERVTAKLAVVQEGLLSLLAMIPAPVLEADPHGALHVPIASLLTVAPLEDKLVDIEDYARQRTLDVMTGLGVKLMQLRDAVRQQELENKIREEELRLFKKQEAEEHERNERLKTAVNMFDKVKKSHV